VYGNRFGPERVNDSYGHWALNRFVSLVTDVLYDTTLSDMLTGYKLFDRRVLDGVTLESDHFEFEPEFTAKVLRRGYRIYEVPVDYVRRDRSEGAKFGWTDSLKVLWTLARYRWRHP